MSITDIANSAIAIVGGERIGSIDDNAKSARNCKQLLPTIVNTCLESALWGFATKTTSLAQLVSCPSDAVAAYQLPNDCVRVGYIDGLPYRVREVTKWRLRGRTLLLMEGSRTTDVSVLYVSKDVPVEWYTPSFRNAVELFLASKLALVLTESKTLADSLNRMAEIELAKAASFDAVQGSSDYRKISRLHAARLAGAPGVNG